MQDNKKILVAMSGGVDSSVAAAILKNQGFEVTGVFMINWREDGDQSSDDNKCSWERDYLDARRVAAKLGIKLFTWDFSEQYKRQVFDYFVKAYEQGLTPNPDTLCNKQIKFGVFLDKARQLGFERIATGHYVGIVYPPSPSSWLSYRLKNVKRLSWGRLVNSTRRRINSSFSRYKLVTPKDKTKDQTYFLYELGQEELTWVIFPVGNLIKKQVRALAKKYHLPVSEKKDSYGICYIGKKNMKEFLAKFIKDRPGEIVDKQGKILGQHQGLHFYTLGQRQRIGIGATGPYYVVKKNIKNNQLVVTTDPNDPDLFKKEIWLKDINWVSGSLPNLPLKCKIRYRHLQKLQRGRVSCTRDPACLKITFNQPQKAIAPGQIAVFYRRLNWWSRDFEVVGGGIIEN